MAVSYTALETALGNHLRAIPGVTHIAWPNVPFTAPKTALWVRPTLLAARAATLTYGTSSVSGFPGVYRINVFGPKGQGIAPVSKLVDDIINAFRAASIDADGINIEVENAWRSSSLSDDLYFQITADISINFIS
ncbi:DUF4128 domain-containing protein [Skermanella mucosa]|uniref:phage tail terminator-like protein n=1 Tax=Skermanella mucosa TaxID=1789672 RepID=UPI00192B308E|nr:phage tail terminator-like protein [Skermanella mucosa]UEM18973.1 DUF4128 domain-containing protein [Skermanella mucosa]